MIRALLYILLIVDAIVLAAVNLAYSGAHFSSRARTNLLHFNTVGVVVLILSILILFLIALRTPKKQVRDHWPDQPPV